MYQIQNQLQHEQDSQASLQSKRCPRCKRITNSKLVNFKKCENVYIENNKNKNKKSFFSKPSRIQFSCMYAIYKGLKECDLTFNTSCHKTYMYSMYAIYKGLQEYMLTFTTLCHTRA